MNEFKRLRNEARNLSRKHYGDLITRIESYGTYTNEAVFCNLSHYDIVLPFDLNEVDIERKYLPANQILDSIELEYEGFSSFLLEEKHTHYLCIKFWKEY